MQFWILEEHPLMIFLMMCQASLLVEGSGSYVLGVNWEPRLGMMKSAPFEGSKRPPRCVWTRELSQPEPSGKVHTFARPPVLEALSLLPVALRVGSYIIQERKMLREPIFDLNGVMLEPPNPGPYGGCPLGGLGGGCIGRGYRGDFRRWSLYPGKYSHNRVDCNQFSIRVKRGNKVFSKVLSVFKGNEIGKSLKDWNWGVPACTVTYHSVFPRAWTQFREPIPGVNVEILQFSPVLPDNYSDSSLPCCVFEVLVTNLGSESIDCSVMFTFENSDGKGSCDELESEGFAHSMFSMAMETESDNVTDGQSSFHETRLEASEPISCEGVCMARHHITRILHDDAQSSVPLHEAKLKEDTNNCDSEIGDDLDGSTPGSEIQESSNFCIKGKKQNDFVFSDQGSFAIATESSQVDDEYVQDVSVCERFIVKAKSHKHLPSGYTDASSLWTAFHEHGSLLPLQPDSGKRRSGEELQPPPFDSVDCYRATSCGSAVCVQRCIPPGESSTFRYSLAWDNPVVRFGSGRAYKRYYSRFVGTSGLSSPTIAAFALYKADSWYTQIEEWQNKTLKDDSLPEFYRYHLFNELYYLVDGGSVWIESESIDVKEENSFSTDQKYPVACDVRVTRLLDMKEVCKEKYVGVSDDQLKSALASQSDVQMNAIADAMNFNDQKVRSCQGNQTHVGRFLYLEGHEYLMYNTYDVHFYAGFALLMLWPQLELSLQRDFAKSVALKDDTLRTMMGEGKIQKRKVAGAVPHDLGSPTEDPFYRTNIYNFQDVSRWKDLGPKFILQVYRDYKYTNSPWFLVDMFPVAVQVMEATLIFDRNNDGMIENEGFPDQTYDIWVASGVQAYCGGLWISSCLAMSEMGKILNDNTVEDKYSDLAARAIKVYNQELWNGEYFNYDSSDSAHHDSIMADMMAGHWYTMLCDLPPVIPPDKAHSCFRKIFAYNVKRFGDGQWMGAVNGMRPNGSVDSSCLQSREVWPGTTYGLAAAMIHESQRGNGMEEELMEMAMNTARGVHDAGWERFGYFFATPEAWEKTGNYRSLGYMRPLAIWAMQYALQCKALHYDA